MQALRDAVCLIENNEWCALDFGAGTGNITGKLLRLGFHVTAVDISPEMCQRLKFIFKDYIESGKLSVVPSSIEAFDMNKHYDLIACYSVLHHLPNYLESIKTLASSLHEGGVMFLDHEANPYWLRVKTSKLYKIYAVTNNLLNIAYYKAIKLKIPRDLNLELADYWDQVSHQIDHHKIEQLFVQLSFSYYECFDYHVRETQIANPLFLIYDVLKTPTTRCWVAKK